MILEGDFLLALMTLNNLLNFVDSLVIADLNNQQFAVKYESFLCT